MEFKREKGRGGKTEKETQKQKEEHLVLTHTQE